MIRLQHKTYAIREVFEISSGADQIGLSDDLIKRIIDGRKFLERFVAKSEQPIYGINTGFGSLCDVEISPDELGLLQENLVKSHACGTGDIVSKEIVKLMLLLKIIGLSKGNSGVRLETVEMLISLFNHNIIPIVFEQGSLGASGDLAPLAHMSLPMLGLGEVWYKSKKVQAQEALADVGLQPISLGAKEGLALLNGTQFMSAYGVYILHQLEHWQSVGLKVAALSLEAFDGRIEPFDHAVHAVRPHSGQLSAAKAIRDLLDGSEVMQQSKKHVQDPYSFRCIPQVHGASADALDHIRAVFETEINAVTDNPTLIASEDKIISAGNFHGQPLAINLDYLCIAIAELGSISERRTYKLISGQRGLPPYLVANPGLNSGLMIAQYAAASIVSQNKQLCTPASIDTIDSSNGQEDHVSMGANAATKAFRVFNNYRSIMAIEMLTAAQARDFRTTDSSPILESLRKDYRTHIPFIENDVVVQPLIQKTIELLS